jgi:hypothetical protein
MAIAALAIAGVWSQGAQAVPILSVSVNGGSEVSFENDQACDGTIAVTCFGTGAADDLLISSFQLDANSGANPFVSASFNFYNGSLTNTISVVATVLFPMVGNLSSPDVALGTGLVSNVFGGGILDLQVEGFIDAPASVLASILEAAPGVPFTVCDDPGTSPDCQGIVGVGIGQAGPALLDIASAIGLRISFSLSPDTVATIGLDSEQDLGGGAFLSLTPQAVVPVPAAAWMFLSALGAVGGLRRARRQ